MAIQHHNTRAAALPWALLCILSLFITSCMGTNPDFKLVGRIPPEGQSHENGFALAPLDNSDWVLIFEYNEKGTTTGTTTDTTTDTIITYVAIVNEHVYDREFLSQPLDKLNAKESLLLFPKPNGPMNWNLAQITWSEDGTHTREFSNAKFEELGFKLLELDTGLPRIPYSELKETEVDMSPLVSRGTDMVQEMRHQADEYEKPVFLKSALFDLGSVLDPSKPIPSDLYDTQSFGGLKEELEAQQQLAMKEKLDLIIPASGQMVVTFKNDKSLAVEHVIGLVFPSEENTWSAGKQDKERALKIVKEIHDNGIVIGNIDGANFVHYKDGGLRILNLMKNGVDATQKMMNDNLRDTMESFNNLVQGSLMGVRNAIRGSKKIYGGLPGSASPDRLPEHSEPNPLASNRAVYEPPGSNGKSIDPALLQTQAGVTKPERLVVNSRHFLFSVDNQPPPHPPQSNTVGSGDILDTIDWGDGSDRSGGDERGSHQKPGEEDSGSGASSCKMRRARRKRAIDPIGTPVLMNHQANPGQAPSVHDDDQWSC